jgi:hypothetical protein
MRKIRPGDGGSGRCAGWLHWGLKKMLEMSVCWPKCDSMEVWKSGCGRDVWLLPSNEEVAESGDCAELGIAGGGGSIGDGVGDSIEAVDNGVGRCDDQDGEIVVTEVNCVGDAEGLSFGVNDAMTVVMLKEDANVESNGAAEVPDAASGWFVVDDDQTAKWQERGGIIAEGAIEVGQG